MTDGPGRPPAAGEPGDPLAPWPPRPSAAPPSGAPARWTSGLLDEPPIRLVALAALTAAALASAVALVVLVALTSDFGVSLGERLRAATGPGALAVPVLLVAAQALAGAAERAGPPAPAGGRTARAVPVGVAGVACTHGALLVGRALADAATLTGAAEAAGGTAGRARDLLVALAGLVLTVAVGWWAAREEPTT